jgi:hypothetical protein
MVASGRGGRVSLARRLAVPATALVLLLATGAAPAAAGTVFFSTANVFFGGKLWAVGDHGGKALSRDRRHIGCFCRRGEIDSIRLDGTHLRRRLIHLPCNEVRCLFGPAVFGWTRG